MTGGYYTMSNSAYIFRFAERKDTELVLSFIKSIATYEGMPDSVKYTKESLEDWLFNRNKGEAIFVLEGEKEVGFCLFYETLPGYIGRGGLYVEDIFVYPEYRGKGYGKALLKKMAEIALQRECGRLEWLCLKWNVNSIQFYKSMGATAMDTCVSFRVEDEALLHMLEK